MFKKAFFPVIILLQFSTFANAQRSTDLTSRPNFSGSTNATDSVPGYLSLTECLKYALKNQPALNQSFIDESIARANNAIGLSSWLPQVSAGANYNYFFQLPTSFTVLNGKLVGLESGVTNTSTPSITANQTIFSADVLLAARAAKLNTLFSKQNTAGVKITLVAEVTKAFYDLLLSIAQTSVYREDTARLKKNLSDAYNGYLSGIVDKVDYKQATISLNNSLSQLKTATEVTDAKYALLKQLIGYPTDKKFIVRFDTAQMMQEIYVDTQATLQFEKRIEYQQLLTTRRIQKETTLYYQLSFLPSLSAFYNYNYEFESNEFSSLYSQAYPYSLFGLQLNIPLFTGFKRTENLRKARLQEERTDWDEVNLKLGIYAQYKMALASYKSNLYYLHSQGENKEMAREVFDIVQLQYREGVKPYLDVIVAETDLQTAEINYLNALYQLLESKVDLEKAMGDIPTNI